MAISLTNILAIKICVIIVVSILLVVIILRVTCNYRGFIVAKTLWLARSKVCDQSIEQSGDMRFCPQFQYHVEALQSQGSKTRALVMIVDNSDSPIVSLGRHEGRVFIGFDLGSHPESMTEKRIRSYFAAIGIEPIESTKYIDNELGELSYPIPGTVDNLANFTFEVLDAVFALKQDEVLEIERISRHPATVHAR